MIDHTFHRGRKYFFCCYFESLSTKEILKRLIKDVFEVNVK